jgi:hypothetical protein
MSKPKTVRRVVTGHRADGRSTVLIDAPAPNVKQRQAGNASTLLWVTEETPALVSGGEVRDNETLLRDFGIGAEVARGHAPRHPAIHRTRSIDYVIVLKARSSCSSMTAKSGCAPGTWSFSAARTTHGSTAGTRCAGSGMVFIDAEEPVELTFKDLS